MSQNYCEKVIINDKNGNLRFRAILEKVTEEKFLRAYKHFNLEPKLYKIIQLTPYEQNNYEQLHFNVKVYVTIDFYDESTWETITLCNELTPLIPYGIAHNYYINQVNEGVNINIASNMILWKYFAKLYSIRFIAKHVPGLLEFNMKSMKATYEAFKKEAEEKLNLVYLKNDPEKSYYLEDRQTVMMKDEFIVASMIHDFLFLKKTPDFNKYLEERQNIL